MKSLPGFLRRSIRADSDDDLEDDEIDSVSSSKDGDDIDGSTAAAQSQDQGQDQAKSSLENSQVDTQDTFTTNESVSSRSASMPVNTKMPQTASLHRQTSEPPQLAQTDEISANPQIEKDRPKTYRETQFEKVFAVNVVSMNELKTLAWNGIPFHVRPKCWKILLGYLPTNASRREHTLQKKRAEYKDAIAQHFDIDDNSRTIQEQEVLRQVLVDVPRTAPSVQLFRDERIKRLLTRILYIWAMRHPASSYVQGINDLAMPLIVTFLAETIGESSICSYDQVLDAAIMETVSDEQLDEIEADCYYCLTNLLAGIQDHYTSDQPGVQRMVLRLEELVNRIDAGLCTHLRDTGIEFMQFAFKWMNCLLLREFNLKCVIRLWDTYISEKDGFEGFHVYVCAAFLCQFSNQLQSMSFDELFGFMQSMPTGDWGDNEIEMLLSQAFVLSTLFGGSDAHLTSSNGR